MKKLFSILLCVVLLTGVCAAASAANGKIILTQTDEIILNELRDYEKKFSSALKESSLIIEALRETGESLFLHKLEEMHKELAELAAKINKTINSVEKGKIIIIGDYSGLKKEAVKKAAELAAEYRSFAAEVKQALHSMAGSLASEKGQSAEDANRMSCLEVYIIIILLLANNTANTLKSIN